MQVSAHPNSLPPPSLSRALARFHLSLLLSRACLKFAPPQPLRPRLESPPLCNHHHRCVTTTTAVSPPPPLRSLAGSPAAAGRRNDAIIGGGARAQRNDHPPRLRAAALVARGGRVDRRAHTHTHTHSNARKHTRTHANARERTQTHANTSHGPSARQRHITSHHISASSSAASSSSHQSALLPVLLLPLRHRAAIVTHRGARTISLLTPCPSACRADARREVNPRRCLGRDTSALSSPQASTSTRRTRRSLRRTTAVRPAGPFRGSARCSTPR